MKKIAMTFFILFSVLHTGFFKSSDSTEDFLKEIPVQSGGRVKPFESFAREALLSVTGRLSLNGQSATSVVWQWIGAPEKWNTQSFLPVRFLPLKKELNLMVIGGKISPELVLTHPAFQEKVQEALEKDRKKEPLLPLEKKRIELYDQARLFQNIAQGSLPGFIPDPENLQAGWIPLAGFADPELRKTLESSYSPRQISQVEEALRQLIESFRQGGKFQPQAAGQFSTSLKQLLENHDIILDQTKLNAERFYNRIHPFGWAWIFYLIAGISCLFFKDHLPKIPVSFFAVGFLAHTTGFILRCLIAGRPPVTNMYESIIWVAWAVVIFSSILGIIYKNLLIPGAAAWVAAFTLVIGESFPAVLDPSLSPLVPVLRNNYWLTIHVLTITLSYGAFALAWGLAHLNLWKFAFHPEKKEEQQRLHEYLYRVLQIGVVLLATGTILGGVWANASWGRFWGWDPKETWALIALLGYLAVLHGRFAGWIGAFGTALGSALAFLGILMAWYGVNFVLAAGFHSYGFGGGGTEYVLALVALDLVFISFLAIRYNKNLNLGARSFTKQT